VVLTSAPQRTYSTFILGVRKTLDLVTDFCLARTDRFDIVLIKRCWAGPVDKSKTLFLS
jgi:hypothetical protein